jgi:esterase/lipase superfamily enzyme
MNERYIKWYTSWLSREFAMLAFGNGGGLPLFLFSTSGARYYEDKDFGLVRDGKWRGHDWNYWQDMLPYYLSVL